MASLDDSTNNTKQHIIGDTNTIVVVESTNRNNVTEEAVSTSAGPAVPSCHSDPNFAIVCAFLQKFAGKLNITYPNFAELQMMLENTDELAEDLKLLIVKLLRKTRKNVPLDKWEHAVSKFCYGYSSQDAWEIERFGYKKSSLAVKLRVLKEIMECQFERNIKFKADVNLVEADELRSQPIGKDSVGNSYWSMTDEELNLRIYQEHLDEDIWKMVAHDRDELAKLIACLKGNDIQMIPSVIGVVDEDSSSNSMTTAPKVDALLNGSQNDEDEDDEEKEKVEDVKQVDKPKLLMTINSAVKAKADETNKDLLSDESEDEENEEADGEDEEDEGDSNESDVDGSSEDSSDSESSEASSTPSKTTEPLKRPSLLASKPPSRKTTPKRDAPPTPTHKPQPPIATNKKPDPVQPPRKRSQTLTSSSEDSDEDKPISMPPAKIPKISRPTLLKKLQSPKTNKYANLKQHVSKTVAKKQVDNEDDEDEYDSSNDDEDDDDEEDDDEEEDSEESEDEDDDEEEVGDEIVEPVMHVKGAGSGRDNKSTPVFPAGDEECVVEEAIEDDIFMVYGEGSGAESMVGNPGGNDPNTSSCETPKEEIVPPKPMFFFGQPGCLKLSPIKKPADTSAKSMLNKYSLFDDDDFGQSSKSSERIEKEERPVESKVMESNCENNGSSSTSITETIEKPLKKNTKTESEKEILKEISLKEKSKPELKSSEIYQPLLNAEKQLSTVKTYPDLSDTDIPHPDLLKSSLASENCSPSLPSKLPSLPENPLDQESLPVSELPDLPIIDSQINPVLPEPIIDSVVPAGNCFKTENTEETVDTTDTDLSEEIDEAKTPVEHETFPTESQNIENIRINLTIDNTQKMSSQDSSAQNIDSESPSIETIPFNLTETPDELEIENTSEHSHYNLTSIIENPITCSLDSTTTKPIQNKEFSDEKTNEQISDDESIEEIADIKVIPDSLVHCESENIRSSISSAKQEAVGECESSSNKTYFGNAFKNEECSQSNVLFENVLASSSKAEIDNPQELDFDSDEFGNNESDSENSTPIESEVDLYRGKSNLHILNFEESSSSAENTVQVPETIWAETSPMLIDIPIRVTKSDANNTELEIERSVVNLISQAHSSYSSNTFDNKNEHKLEKVAGFPEPEINTENQTSKNESELETFTALPEPENQAPLVKFDVDKDTESIDPIQEIPPSNFKPEITESCGDTDSTDFNKITIKDAEEDDNSSSNQTIPEVVETNPSPSIEPITFHMNETSSLKDEEDDDHSSSHKTITEVAENVTSSPKSSDECPSTVEDVCNIIESETLQPDADVSSKLNLQFPEGISSVITSISKAKEQPNSFEITDDVSSQGESSLAESKEKDFTLNLKQTIVFKEETQESTKIPTIVSTKLEEATNIELPDDISSENESSSSESTEKEFPSNLKQGMVIVEEQLKESPTILSSYLIEATNIETTDDVSCQSESSLAESKEKELPSNLKQKMVVVEEQPKESPAILPPKLATNIELTDDISSQSESSSAESVEKELPSNLKQGMVIEEEQLKESPAILPPNLVEATNIELTDDVSCQSDSSSAETTEKEVTSNFKQGIIIEEDQPKESATILPPNLETNFKLPEDVSCQSVSSSAESIEKDFHSNLKQEMAIAEEQPQEPPTILPHNLVEATNFELTDDASSQSDSSSAEATEKEVTSNVNQEIIVVDEQPQKLPQPIEYLTTQSIKPSNIYHSLIVTTNNESTDDVSSQREFNSEEQTGTANIKQPEKSTQLIESNLAQSLTPPILSPNLMVKASNIELTYNVLNQSVSNSAESKEIDLKQGMVIKDEQPKESIKNLNLSHNLIETRNTELTDNMSDQTELNIKEQINEDKQQIESPIQSIKSSTLLSNPIELTHDTSSLKINTVIENPQLQELLIGQVNTVAVPESKPLPQVAQPSNLQPEKIVSADFVNKKTESQQDSDQSSDDDRAENEDHFGESASSYSDEESQDSLPALNLTKTEPQVLNLISNKPTANLDEVKPSTTPLPTPPAVLDTLPKPQKAYSRPTPSSHSQQPTPGVSVQAPKVVTPPAPPKVRLTWSVLKNLAEGRPSILSQPPPVEHTTPEPVVIPTPAVQPTIVPKAISKHVVLPTPTDRTTMVPKAFSPPPPSRTPSRSPTPADANQIESPKFSSILDPPSPTSSSNPPSLQHSDDTSDSQDSDVIPLIKTKIEQLPIVTPAQSTSLKLSALSPKQSAPIIASATKSPEPATTIGSSRKRRISVPKQRLTSESSDAGDSISNQDQPEEEVVAQKRPKMRAKTTQQVQRKEAENKRSIKQADWSSDDEDESQRQQQPKKKPVAVNQTTTAVIVDAVKKVQVPKAVPETKKTSKAAPIVETSKVLPVAQLPQVVPEERKPAGRGTRNSLRNAIATPTPQPEPKISPTKQTPTAIELVPPAPSQASPVDLIVKPPKAKPLTKKEKENLRKETAKAKQLEKKRLAEEARQQKAAEKTRLGEEAMTAKKLAEEVEAAAIKEAEVAAIKGAKAAAIKEAELASIKEAEAAVIIEAKAAAVTTKEAASSKKIKARKTAENESIEATEAASIKKESEAKLEPSLTATDEPKTSPNKPEPRRRKKRSLMGLDIDDAMLEKLKEEPPVRQSRRIAQIKIKEEAERRDIEEIVLNKLKAASDRKKSSTGTPTQSGGAAASREDPAFKPSSVKSEDDSDSDGSFSTDHKRDAKKKKKKLPKGANPWQTDSEGGDASDAAAEDALYEQHYESDHKMGALKSDHEFSPESDLESDVVVPVKRARTARKDDWVDEEEDEYACQKCAKHDHPEWILLCDTCDKGYHCSCLVPMLFLIPEGDWFCPPCQQQKLIVSLESHLLGHQKALRKKVIDQQLQEEQLAKENEIKRENKEREKEEEEEFKPEKFSQDTSRRRKPPRNRYRRRKRASDSEMSARSSRGSNTKSSCTSSSSANSSDDEPIYKLRKRRPTGVSYMYNEYDHLIDKAMQKEWDAAEGITDSTPAVDQLIDDPVAEPKKERMPVVAAVKQPRCGKVMGSESEVEDDDEPEKEHRTGKHMPGEDSEEEVTKKKVPPKEDDDNDSEMSEIRPKVINRGGKKKKKTRKLNSLDIESEDDGSDDDFRTSSFSEEEDDDFSASDNDSSLDSFRNKRRRGKKETRRSARARRKRIDKDFINDTDDDDDLPLIRTRKAKKKVESDFSDDDGSTDEDAEELDSEDLCQSTDSNESDQPWGSSKKKKKKGGPIKKAPVKRVSDSSDSSGGKKIKTVKPKVITAPKPTISKPKVPIATKSDHSDDDEEEAKAKSSDESDDDDDSFSKSKKRRTRGNKLTYLLDDFESSDDGIKPGVKRPDTPPEERAAFIKRQEDIKRMLAERNTEAARALAAPKINSIPTPEKRRAAPDSLSTIPLQIIQSAKALDVDLKRLGKDTASDIDDPDPFGGDLPDDFDPEDMDEDEITKMMEEEDFAQHQLKLAGEAIRNKKVKDAELQQARKKDLQKEDAFMVATGPASVAMIDPRNIPLGAGPSTVPSQGLPIGERQMGPHPGQPMYGPGGQQPHQLSGPPHGPRGNYLEQMRALGHGIPGPHHMQQPQRNPMGPHSVIRHPHGMPGPHGQAPPSNHPGMMQGHPGGPHGQGHPGFHNSPLRHGILPSGSPVVQGQSAHPGYQGHPSHGPPPASSHRPPIAQHMPHGHQGHPNHPPPHGMHPNAPVGPHNPYAPRNPHSMMFGVRPTPNQHPANMSPGSQIPYGMRTAPNHYGPRQMMHDPRQSLMQHQHPSGSGGSGVVDYPHDSKVLKLTKTGAEPKKRGRKSKAELQAIETTKYPAGQSPPIAHGMPSMAIHQQPPPSMLNTAHPLHSPPPPPPSHSLISSSASGSVADSMIPTSVLSVQNARLLDPSELGPPGGANQDSAAEAPAKKKGRRKKFTPLREDLHKPTSGVDLSGNSSGPAPQGSTPATSKPTAVTSTEASRIVEPKTSSILSKRLSETRSTLSVASPPQLYSPPSAGPQPSVITRLPRSQPGAFPPNHYPPTHPGLPSPSNLAPGQTSTSPIIRHPPYSGIQQQHGGPPPLNHANLPANSPSGPAVGQFSHSPTEAGAKGVVVRQTAPPHGPGMYRPHFQGPGYPKPPGPPPPMHREGVAAGEGSAPPSHAGFPPSPYGQSAYGNYYAPPPATSPAVVPPPSTPPTVQPIPQSSPTPTPLDRSRPPQTSPVISHPPHHEPRPVGQQPLSQPTSVVVSGPSVVNRSFEQFDNASSSKYNPAPHGRCSPGVYRASTITAVSVADEDVSSGPAGNDSNSSGADRRHSVTTLQAPPKSPSADVGGTSEFSGLVSYFSSQQDDLES